MRAYPLKPFSESDKSASFAVISIHGSYVPQVRFLNGAEESREAESTIAAIKCNTVFPDEAPTRIFRGGNLSCSHLWKECRFILFPCPARDLFPHKVPSESEGALQSFLNPGCRSGPSSAQAVEPVKRRCFIAFGEGGIVEDGVDEVGDLALQLEDRLPDMQELRRVFAKNMHAQQLERLAVNSSFRRLSVWPEICPRVISSFRATNGERSLSTRAFFLSFIAILA